MSSDVTEVGYEFAIITNKTKKFLNFCNILKRGGPFCDCFHLFGVDGYIAVGNNVSKVFDGCSSEFTFLEFAVPLMVMEFLHDLFDMIYVFVFGR